MDLLQTKTKAKSTILTILVAVANTVGIGYGLPALTIAPDATDSMATATVIIWLLNVAILYMPTIVTMIASRTYIKAKTEQNIAGIQAGTLAPVAVGSAPAGNAEIAAPKPQPAAPPTYSTPPVLAEIRSDAPTAFLRWAEFANMLNVDLTNFNPQVRMDFALDILKENKARLDAAWIEELRNEKVGVMVDPPEHNDFVSYDTSQEYQKTIRDAIPGCAWLTASISQLMQGYGTYYDGLEWTQKLYGKTIRWTLANSINGFVLHQYSAVES